MTKYILTVTLNPALDKIFTLDHFSVGKEYRAPHVREVAGGKGLNVARVLKALGMPVRATGFLGGETGNAIRGLLDQENIPYDFLSIKSPTRINMTIVSSRLKRQTRILEEGPRVSSVESRLFVKKYKRLLAHSRAVIISGRNVPGVPSDFYRQLVAMAHDTNVASFVDTHGEPLRRALKARPFLIKPNLEEAQEILGVRLRTKQQIRHAAADLRRMGAYVVLLSMGGDGAIVDDGHQFFWGRVAKVSDFGRQVETCRQEIFKNSAQNRITPREIAKRFPGLSPGNPSDSTGQQPRLATYPRIKGVQDVGCGDAMVAAFVYGYFKKYSLEENLRLSVASGTANLRAQCPGGITQKAVLRMKKYVRVVRF